MQHNICDQHAAIQPVPLQKRPGLCHRSRQRPGGKWIVGWCRINCHHSGWHYAMSFKEDRDLLVPVKTTDMTSPALQFRPGNPVSQHCLAVCLVCMHEVAGVINLRQTTLTA